MTKSEQKFESSLPRDAKEKKNVFFFFFFLLVLFFLKHALKKTLKTVFF